MAHRFPLKTQYHTPNQFLYIRNFLFSLLAHSYLDSSITTFLLKLIFNLSFFFFFFFFFLQFISFLHKQLFSPLNISYFYPLPSESNTRNHYLRHLDCLLLSIPFNARKRNLFLAPKIQLII